MSKGHTVLGYFLLLMTALIWGSAFVAQKYGVEKLPPAAFNGIRNIVGGFALMLFVFFRDLTAKRKFKFLGKGNHDSLILGGICCGFFLGFASLMQQVGIERTSVGKAGFITVLYIMIVPILGILLGQKSSWQTWCCVLLAMAGFYFLSFSGKEGEINTGDIYCFVCSILFSLHILTISRFAPKVDGVRLSALQFFIAGVISLSVSVLLERGFTLKETFQSWLPILYTGVLSCGVAYTLQIVAQKWVRPVVASLIMSLESCFAVLFGGLLLHERLAPRELVGCLIIFMAVIITTVREN